MTQPTPREVEEAARRLGLSADPTTLADLEILTRSNRIALTAASEEPHVFARGAYSFGYVMAVFVPFVGFLIGLALLARSDDNEGRDAAWIIGVSMVSAVIGAVAFLYLARR